MRSSKGRTGLKQLLFTLAVLSALLPAAARETVGGNYAALPWKSTDGTGRIETVDGRRIAVIDVPEGSEKGQHWLTAPVDLTPFLDRRVTMSVRCRWSGVTPPLEPWNGVKFMLDYVGGNGAHFWCHPQKLWNSRDWGEISVVIEPPEPGSHSGRLVLGLESSSGRVEFDLDSLRTFVMFSPQDRVNLDYKASYPEKIAGGPRRRGVMSPHRMTEEDFKTLKEWNVNLVRFQLMRNWGRLGTELDLADYDRWINARLDRLAGELDLAARYGIKAVIDLHTPPGGSTDGKNMLMFFDKKYHDHFIEVWKRIAKRFRCHPAVWAYDLINEPTQVTPAPFDYWTTQKNAAEAVRAIDPDTPVIIESNEADRPQTYPYLSPLAMDNVIYEVHMYMPTGFTHQGVEAPEPYRSYPGSIYGTVWDKEKIRETLQPVRDFQLRHNAKIYVGEFSAVIWAPGADRYLEDCIEIFEEYGWDWSYHAFREWNGWSLEHEGESHVSMRPSPDNARKRVLLKYFSRNTAE